MQRGVEGPGVAEMGDHLAAVDVGLEEAEHHAVERQARTSRCVVCISRAVSGDRMRWPSSSPPLRWAIMKRAMSAPVEDIDSGRRRADDLELDRSRPTPSDSRSP